MTHWRKTCLIGDQHASSTPIEDRHASSETQMPHRRPTCRIGDQYASSETDMPHRRPKYLIGDPFDMLDQAFWSPTRHVVLQSVISCRSGMLVYDGSLIRQVGPVNMLPVSACYLCQHVTCVSMLPVSAYYRFLH